VFRSTERVARPRRAFFSSDQGRSLREPSASSANRRSRSARCNRIRPERSNLGIKDRDRARSASRQFPINALNTPSADFVWNRVYQPRYESRLQRPLADLTRPTSARPNHQHRIVWRCLRIIAHRAAAGSARFPAAFRSIRTAVCRRHRVFSPTACYADFEQNFTPLPANASSTAEQNAEIAREDTTLEQTAEWMSFAATNGSSGASFPSAPCIRRVDQHSSRAGL